MAALLTISSAVKAECRLSIPATTIEAGSSQSISIDLENTEGVTAFQFCIKFPNGFSVNSMTNEDEETVPAITLSERKKSKHSITMQQQEDGSYKIVVLSTSNQVFSGNGGAIINISVTPSATVQNGIYEILMSEIAICPITDGVIGETIKQEDFTATITINNKSQSNEVHASLSLGTEELEAGSISPLYINLTNNIEITAAQLNIMLPQGINIVETTNEDGDNVPNVSLTERKKSKHNVIARQQEDGSYTIAALSTTNQPFTGNDGALIKLNVSISATMTGTQEILLSNIVLVPLVEGKPGISITQEPVTAQISISNSGGGTISGDNTLTVNRSTVYHNEPAYIGIEMKNNKAICAIQFNIKLPQGVNIVKEYNEDDEFAPVIELTSRKKSSHELSFKEKEGNEYFVMAYSLSNATFKDNSGEIVRLKVQAEENLPEGEYGIVLSNVIMTTSDEEKIEQEAYSGTIDVSSKTGIEETGGDSNITIKSTEGGIAIYGTANNDIISVYDVDGKCIAERLCKSGNSAINTERTRNIIVTVSRNGKVIFTRKFLKTK